MGPSEVKENESVCLDVVPYGKEVKYIWKHGVHLSQGTQKKMLHLSKIYITTLLHIYMYTIA